MDPAQKLLIATNLRTLVWHVRTSNPIVDEAIQKNLFGPYPLSDYQSLVLEMAPQLEKYVARQGALKGEDFKTLLKEFANSKENYYDRLSRAIEKRDVSLLTPEYGKEADKPTKESAIAAPPPSENKSAQPIPPKIEPSQSQPGKKEASPEAKTPIRSGEQLQQEQQARIEGELIKGRKASKASGKSPNEPVTTAQENAAPPLPTQKAPRSGFFIRRPGRSVRSVPGLARTFRRVSIPALGGIGRIFSSGPVRNMGSMAARAVRFGSTRGETGVKNLLDQTGRQAADMATQPGGGAGNRGKGGGGNLAGFNIPGLDRILNRGGERSGGFRRIARGGGRRLLIILLLLLVGGFLLGLFNIFGEPTAECGKGGEVNLQKSGPAEVENGKQIIYQIVATFKGNCAADIDISDQIPQNTKFISASNPLGAGGFSQDIGPTSLTGKLEGNSVVWRLKSVQPNQITSLSFTVEPTTEDVWVVNEASYNAKFQGSGTIQTNTGPSGGTLSPEAALEQDRVIQAEIGGQGRNVNIIGDENAFTAQVIANGVKLGLTADKEQYIRQIYQAAQKWNVNPLIVLGTWGTETGFRTDLLNVAMSCPVRVSTSFDRQANCAAETYSNWMKAFERDNKIGTLKIGENCVYNDPMIYALEWYGPICHAQDDNVNFRPNMLKFYKTILGKL